MKHSKEAVKLFREKTGAKSGCNLCRESNVEAGKDAGYGIVVYRIGNKKNGWFATLSPKTGGNPKTDFTIQLMPMLHLTHFSQISSYPKLAENFGIAFAKLSTAMASIMIEDERLLSHTAEKNKSVPMATYGKCTTWKDKKEHLHIKIFPFRGDVGQPYTVDSSFEKKEIFRENGEEFVKMNPVKKEIINPKKLGRLAGDLIRLLK